MFGRYSLDVPGLAYAGGEWDDSQYTTFQPDADGIIGDTQGTEDTTGATGGSVPDTRMHLG